MACCGLTFGTAVVAVIAALIGLPSVCDNEVGLVAVTKPLNQRFARLIVGARSGQTGESSHPVWVITEEQAKWLRGWFPDDLKVECYLFTGTKQEPRLEAKVAFFSPTQRPIKIPMDVLIPKPCNFDDRRNPRNPHR